MKKVQTLVVVSVCVAALFAGPVFAGTSDQGPVQGDQGQVGQSGPVPPANPGDSGQSGQSGQSDPCAGKKDCQIIEFFKKIFCHKQDQEVAKKLLNLVLSDLQLALSEIQGKKVSYFKVFPAIEHLNHALEALEKVQKTRDTWALYRELSRRISHTKFTLVAYDLKEAEARLLPLIELVQKLIPTDNPPNPS